MKSFLSSVLLWLLFLAGLSACIGSGVVLHGTAQHVATYAGLALSLVGGSGVARREPVKSVLASRKTQWFLFLFNGAAAGAVCLLAHGSQGLMATAGLGVVALGAGLGLLRRPVRQAH